MPKEKQQTLFKRVVKELIKPAFKAEGFTTSGQTFRKEENGFVKVFNIQWDGRDPEEMSFIFNIGFFVRYVHDLDYIYPVLPKKADEPSCCYRMRVGIGRDSKWIDINKNTKFENIKPSVTKAVAESINLFRSIATLYDLPTKKGKVHFKNELYLFADGSPQLKLGMGLSLIKLGDKKLGMKLYNQGYVKFVAWLREMKAIRDKEKFKDTYPEGRWKTLNKIAKELHIRIKDKNYY